MSTTVSITAAGGHVLEAARSEPTGPPKGGVIVLHAIYGLTDHIRDVCDLWAADGYVGLAPALYDRLGPRRVYGYDKTGAAGGRADFAALTAQSILDDIKGCMSALAGAGPIVVSGFCSGGSWAWVAAAQLDGIAAQVNFYGSHVASRHLALAPRCPTIIHYGDADHVVPIDQIERIGAAHPAVELHVYPGAGHAFFNPGQDHHDPAAAALARRRSLDFLARALSSPAA